MLARVIRHYYSKKAIGDGHSSTAGPSGWQYFNPSRCIHFHEFYDLPRLTLLTQCWDPLSLSKFIRSLMLLSVNGNAKKYAGRKHPILASWV